MRRLRPIDATAYVLDASAVLAVVFDEPGADAVRQALKSNPAMSAVNAGEVALAFDELGIEILPFDRRCALLSGHYRPATRSLGLGLEDRACLATAHQQERPALTADRAWEALEIDVEVVCIR